MGRLIPAGTGLPAYKRLDVVVEDCEFRGMPPAQPPHEDHFAAVSEEE